MLFSRNTLVSSAAVLMTLCNVATATPQDGPIDVGCYTYTRDAPSPACPTLSCAPRPTDNFCPQMIRVSSVTVPCATEACPTTATVYDSTAACPTCAACPVPTQWITYTTGCAADPAATITAMTIETPAWNAPMTIF
ncbi:uncharacterized protein GGS25DRAFT_522429 [Hypoxylon fragiforme]|uniref:uncharacterized protein n=1 Tax=Hypoxylon fragiforme TaxID=63214 RepID=UPI0020C6F101|nr:uncharacterized protein GGS25DRAFT_522429 [Hypoxylon fragiforme]KAI2606913.1 hypothetical protein GGS25DRAFT_522429 [Hypoxylon fragiforme]